MDNFQTDTSKTNILVVDDTPDNLRLLVDILTRRGYKVRPARSGEMALSSVRLAPPELILLDILMPDMDGYDVCKQLKADERTRDIPVIFISALNEEIDKVKAFSVGGVDYITKPFRIEEVMARIETHMALQRRSYELALLNRVGRDLTATLNLQRIAEQIQEAVTEVVGAEGTSVWLMDRVEEEWLDCLAAFHQGLDHFSSDLRVRSGQGVVGWVMETGESVLVNDATEDTRFFSGIDEQTGFITNSLLAVPLRARDRVIGVLEVVNKLDGGFDMNDLVLAETIAASAAIAIDNTWLFEALCQHAIELETSNSELKKALIQVKTLSGLLPICSHCKKIRNDEGYWQQIEVYLEAHSEAQFSHGLCADCTQELYPELYEMMVERRQNILDYLGKGRTNLEMISIAVGLPESNTQNRLEDMVEEGLIKRILVDGQTLYELP